MGVFGRFAAAARSAGVWEMMGSSQLSVQAFATLGEIRAGMNPAPTVFGVGEGLTPSRWSPGD